MSSSAHNHWDVYARQWSRITAPLRPSVEDVAILQRRLAPAGKKGLLLGVTPELRAMSEEITPVDKDPEMIARLSDKTAVLANWLSIPFAEDAFDFACGDGCLTMLAYPAEYHRVLSQLGRVVKPGGLVSFRAFVSPAEPEPVAAVIRDAGTGAAGSFHAFKWRWVMALLAEQGEVNIAVRYVYDAFLRAFPDMEALAHTAGWDIETVRTIEAYRDSDTMYSFPTLKEVEVLLRPDWELVAVDYGSYELAERCPTVTVRNVKGRSSRVGFVEAPPLEDTADIRSVLNQIEKTQWLPPEEMRQLQEKQLRQLVAYAAEHSPHFAQRLAEAGLAWEEVATVQGLQALPPVHRRTVQSCKEEIESAHVPKSHLPCAMARTSGSTGEPVVIKRTKINQLFYYAYTMRGHGWHARDFAGTAALIRAGLGIEEGVSSPHWGAPVTLFAKTGTAHAFPINKGIEAQVAWLQQVNPEYLTTYPSNLSGLLDSMEQRQITLPRLREVATMGETLRPELRQRVADTLGVRVVDNYSSEEFGVIAMQCPEHQHYHSMEGLIVEILDDADQPCAVGEVGRVVITDLYNFAMPLVRYAIGDYARQGSACACGRGLPVIEEVLGRERNLAIVNGKKLWPQVGFAKYREVAPVVQYQVIQHTATDLEVRLVTERDLTAEEERALAAVLCDALQYRFTVTFTYFQNALPRALTGKHEEFICHCTA